MIAVESVTCSAEPTEDLPQLTTLISIKGLERIDWHFKDSLTMRKSKNYADSGSNQSMKVYNHLSSFMLESRTHYLKCLN